jgi:hypothetical protein
MNRQTIRTWVLALAGAFCLLFAFGAFATLIQTPR